MGEKKEQEGSKEFFDSLIAALEKRQKKILRAVKKKHKKILAWAQSKGYDLGQIQKKVGKVAATSALSAGLILGTAGPITALSVPIIEEQRAPPNLEGQETARLALLSYFEKYGKNKNLNNELVEGEVAKATGLPVKAALSGHRLPRVYGRIGTEQHLYRFPGDRLSSHLQHSDWKYSWAGMAPKLGAWGYFADSRGEMTEEANLYEKYYLAVQTFAIPGWDRNWYEWKDWWKFRKMLVYNPENGKAVVAIVGDSGPAIQTGKAFGGSPEVMDGLGLERGAEPAKGVIILFLDDPAGKIPLGPLGPQVPGGEETVSA